MNDIDRGYIAGLIDGEGSISLTRNHENEFRYPAVSVSSTTIELMNYLKDKCQGHISTKKKYKENHTQSYAWSLRGDKAIELLREIKEYLRVPQKVYRANLIVNRYKEVTPRNGRYSDDLLKQKQEFEKQFFEFE